jgi:hypothetical protein
MTSCFEDGFVDPPEKTDIKHPPKIHDEVIHRHHLFAANRRNVMDKADKNNFQIVDETLGSFKTGVAGWAYHG